MVVILTIRKENYPGYVEYTQHKASWLDFTNHLGGYVHIWGGPALFIFMLGLADYFSNHLMVVHSNQGCLCFHVEFAANFDKWMIIYII